MRCRKHSPAVRVFSISLVFSNARRVISLCDTRVRLFYLLNKTWVILSHRVRTGSYLSVTHSAHILTSSVIYHWRVARQHGIYLFYLITKQTTTDKAKAGLCPLWRTRKKPFDVIYYLYKMKQCHWFLCVAKNYDWSRKVTPLANLTRASLLVQWKLSTKAELNCEIHKS